MEGFQSVQHFVEELHKAIVNLIPTKVSQLENDTGYKTKDTSYSVATSTSDGLMSKDDKALFDRKKQFWNNTTWGDLLGNFTTWGDLI